MKESTNKQQDLTPLESPLSRNHRLLNEGHEIDGSHEIRILNKGDKQVIFSITKDGDRNNNNENDNNPLKVRGDKENKNLGNEEMMLMFLALIVGAGLVALTGGGAAPFLTAMSDVAGIAQFGKNFLSKDDDGINNIQESQKLGKSFTALLLIEAIKDGVNGIKDAFSDKNNIQKHIGKYLESFREMDEPKKESELKELKENLKKFFSKIENNVDQKIGADGSKIDDQKIDEVFEKFKKAISSEEFKKETDSRNLALSLIKELGFAGAKDVNPNGVPEEVLKARQEEKERLEKLSKESKSTEVAPSLSPSQNPSPELGGQAPSSSPSQKPNTELRGEVPSPANGKRSQEAGGKLSPRGEKLVNAQQQSAVR